MKKLYQILFLSTALLPIVACNPDNTADDGIVEYFPVKVDSNEDWGFIGPDGKIYLPDEFKNQPTCVIEGCFTEEEGEGYTVFKFGEKKAEQLGDLEGLKEVGYFCEGLLGIVRPHERVAFVNKQGNTVFTLDPVDNKEIVMADADFSDGMVRIKNEDGKYGYANTKGEVVIKPKYSEANNFYEGLTLVTITNDADERKIVIINKKGEEIAKVKSGYSISGFILKDGCWVIREDENGRMAFLDKKGEITKLPPKVKGVGDYNSEYYMFKNEEGDWGLMSRNGEEMIRAKYDGMAILPNGKFIAKKGDKFLLLDKNGDKVENQYSDYESLDVLPGKGFKLVAKDGDDYCLIDYVGKPIGQEEFTSIGMRLTQSYVLFSDYFNLTAYIDAMSALVENNSICSYKLGTSPQKYLTSPNDYSYSYAFSPDTEIKGGFRYNFELLRIRCNEVIAQGSWDYNTYNYNYYFNDQSKINYISLKAYSDVDVWNDAKPLIINNFRNKGFKLEDETDSKIEMSADHGVKLEISKSGNAIYLTLTQEIPTSAE